MTDYTKFTPTGEKILFELSKLIKAAGVKGLAADLAEHWLEGALSEEEILKFLRNYNNRSEL